MKISISNIGWAKENDEYMYKYLQYEGIHGIEIAPTRIFPENPYDKILEAKKFSNKLNQKYNLLISSMQSIWFGKKENLFSSLEEREMLFEYTKKAIDFARAINCKNLVFGCPRNRIIKNDSDIHTAIKFFKGLGKYALDNSTTVSIEPNPTIYNTNFINTTEQAFEFVKKVNSKGIMVNVDLGTVIKNNESLDSIYENVELVNHIHISEPFLDRIKQREYHKNLSEFLKCVSYRKFISVEMKNLNNINIVKEVIEYIKDVFI